MRHHPRTTVIHRRLRRVLTTVLAAGVAVVGATATSAAASQGAVIRAVPDFEQPFFDACTGEFRIVTFSDNQLVFRRALDAEGNFHEVGVLSGNWSAGPYTGTYRNPRVVNDLHPYFFDDFSFTEVIVATGGDGSGTRLTLQVTTHFRVLDGQFTASVERVDARCVVTV